MAQRHFQLIIRGPWLDVCWKNITLSYNVEICPPDLIASVYQAIWDRDVDALCELWDDASWLYAQYERSLNELR